MEIMKRNEAAVTKCFCFLKRCSILIVLFLYSVCFSCFAETVYFNNGKKMDGAIQDITMDGLFIKVGGVSLRYSLEDIYRVDVFSDGSTRQDILDYIEALNMMITDDLRDVDQKEAEIMQLRLEGKPWHGYYVSEDARNLVTRHRYQMELIKAPALCEGIRKLYLQWMLLRENKHNAMFHQDWDQADGLKEEIADCAEKIKNELKRIHWLLENAQLLNRQEPAVTPDESQGEVKSPVPKDDKKPPENNLPPDYKQNALVAEGV
ncbi:MAG: hypothetical protein ABIC68_05315 [Candidatus Omnitrophota bacterium]